MSNVSTLRSRPPRKSLNQVPGGGDIRHCDALDVVVLETRHVGILFTVTWILLLPILTAEYSPGKVGNCVVNLSISYDTNMCYQMRILS